MKKLIRARARNLAGQPVERERVVQVASPADAETIQARWAAELRGETLAVTATTLAGLLGTSLVKVLPRLPEFGGLEVVGSRRQRAAEHMAPRQIVPLRQVWLWLAAHYHPAADGRTFAEFLPGQCDLLAGLYRGADVLQDCGVSFYVLRRSLLEHRLGYVLLPWSTSGQRFLVGEMVDRGDGIFRGVIRRGRNE